MSVYDVLKIEKRGDGTFFVLDKRGPNVIEAGPFKTIESAQIEWSQQADDVHIQAILDTPDEDALAGRWPRPDHTSEVLADLD